MGNNTSSNAQPGSGHAESPKSTRRDTTRHPIPLHHRRSIAAPPEPSLAQAHGTIPHAPATLTTRQGSVPPNSSLNTTPGSATPVRGSSEPEQTSATKPVDVPESNSQASRSPFPAHMDAELALASSVQDLTYITRPPRLPLPIEEELHTPGSPMVDPAHLGDALEDADGLDEEGLPARVSTLSSSTVDEDDAEELRVDKTRPTVPTRLEWRRGGEKVYVTGTIFQWNRKTRLHPVEGSPGVFAATINILPGTHHVRFLVDGQMQTSPDLPTTVDFGNNLVNYIEVNPDDVVPTQPPETPDALSEAKEAEIGARGKFSGKVNYREAAPRHDFSRTIPSYLLDFDQQEDSKPYQSAIAAIEKLPNPPALPGFLGKPILNAAASLKDDNSVLTLPNHTVLNHLMTSSIKNNILAVSGTTRYKDKYVTSIIYKPTTPHH